MVNLILGLIAGIIGSVFFFKGETQSWYIWTLLVLGLLSLIFSMDVFLGSLKEHENRAAMLGLLMFGLSGIVMLGVSFFLGFRV